MSTTGDRSVRFAEAEDRTDAMHGAIKDWLTELSELVDEARATEEFQAWLDAQSRFPDYSARNTLLINRQRPGATRVAGFRTWQAEFDRHVKEGESAIWIWAPIIAKRCPACEHSKSYHESSDCDYDETPPDAWSKGLVGFKPAPVFDIAQTDGEPLPPLETEAYGEAEGLVESLIGAAEAMDIEARIVGESGWPHGSAAGVCRHRNGEPPLVEVRTGQHDADLAATLIHEFAHAKLHGGVDDSGERAKREVEAEAVAYVVGRHFGLDPSNSAFYLAAWQGEQHEVLKERMERISRTAGRLIEVVES